jgi:hypothetical protein
MGVPGLGMVQTGHGLTNEVRPEGFEPSTLGLRVPCSTN